MDIDPVVASTIALGVLILLAVALAEIKSAAHRGRDDDPNWGV